MFNKKIQETKEKDPARVDFGRQLGNYNKQHGGSEYFSKMGKIGHETRIKQDPDWYSKLGKKSAAKKKAKKEAVAREEAKKKQPIHIINSFLTGKTKSIG